MTPYEPGSTERTAGGITPYDDKRAEFEFEPVGNPLSRESI